MEQALGNVNWTKYNPPVYPGQVRLWTIQNFLRGCQGTVYFSWRQSRFGSEQYHSAFIGHDGYRRKPFNEVMELVKELDRLPQNFFRRQKAQVALLYSFEDLWALQLQPHNAHFDYPQLVREMHASLYKQHTPVDVLPKDTALAVLKEYKLVIALAPVLGDEYIAGIWREYVEQGGKLLLVTRAGEKEITNIWTSEAQPHSMHNWVGVRVDEQISFPPYLPGQYQNLLIGDTPASKDTPLLLFDEITGRQVQARRLWLESLEPYEGTEVILRYGFGTEGDFFLFMNSVAFTCNKVQQGEVYYLGALPNEDTYRYLWEEVFREECVPVAPELPRENGLEIVRAGIAGEYLVLLNHSSHALEFSLGKRYRTMDGAEVERANMPPFSVLFLAEIS
jgi:beta-galactosidase